VYSILEEYNYQNDPFLGSRQHVRYANVEKERECRKREEDFLGGVRVLFWKKIIIEMSHFSTISVSRQNVRVRCASISVCRQHVRVRCTICERSQDQTYLLIPVVIFTWLINGNHEATSEIRFYLCSSALSNIFKDSSIASTYR
jgi:hypothetical protein